MRPNDNHNLPPPHLLEAMRQPRRPQLDDARVRQLFKRWKALGRPIEYSDLNDVADIIAPGQKLGARTRAKIVAAVEAAGIEIHSWDSLRETKMHIVAHGPGDGWAYRGVALAPPPRVRPSRRQQSSRPGSA